MYIAQQVLGGYTLLAESTFVPEDDDDDDEMLNGVDMCSEPIHSSYT